jgi:hypothetical protein
MLNIPTTLIAGDRWSWLESDLFLPDGSQARPNEYTLGIALGGPSRLDIIATEEDGSWRLTATSVETSYLAAGVYQWQAYLKDGADRYTIGSGTVEIKPNLETQIEGIEGRPYAEVALERVQNCILALLENRPVQEYKILGRETKYMNLLELQQMRDSLQAEVARIRRQRLGKRDVRLARFISG